LVALQQQTGSGVTTMTAACEATEFACFMSAAGATAFSGCEVNVLGGSWTPGKSKHHTLVVLPDGVNGMAYYVRSPCWTSAPAGQPSRVQQLSAARCACRMALAVTACINLMWHSVSMTWQQDCAAAVLVACGRHVVLSVLHIMCPSWAA
jgi:hypothetical protein